MSVDWSKYTPIAKQTGLSIAASSTGLTVPTATKPRAALVQVLVAPIRFWVDTSTPTASQGHRADVNDQIELASYAEVNNFRAIRETTVSATLEITYYT